MLSLRLCLTLLLVPALFGCLGPFSSKKEPLIIPPSALDSSLPLDAQALWQQAEIEEKAGDTDSAIKTLERITEKYPTNVVSARALYQLGNIYLRQKKADRALKHFDAVINQYPHWNGIAMVWVDRLRALRMKGERKEVLKQALALWQISSDYPEIQMPLSLLIANTYKDDGNLESAFEWLGVAFEKAQSPGEKESLARDTLGVLNHMGEAGVEKVLLKNPPEFIQIFLKYRLAQIMREKGQTELARQHLAQLSNQSASHPLAPEIQAALAEIASATMEATRSPGGGTASSLEGPETAAQQSTRTSTEPLSGQGDSTPPEIVLTSPTAPEPLKVAQETTRVTITGKVSDDSGVSQVLVNNAPAQMDADGNFTAEVFLKAGDSAIEVLAMDALENRAKKTIPIDRESASGTVHGTLPASTTSARFAVIIGVSRYQDPRIPSLRYAANDARAFYEWAVSPEGGRYTPSRVKLLVDDQATGKNIKDALFVWLKQAIEEDVVTIYFAGHGSPESPDSPGNLFLLPYDTQYESIATTGFPMWDIETALRRFIKAKKVVVVADACHAGGVGQGYDTSQVTMRGIEEVNPISSGLQNLSKIGDGICVISASDEKQFSQESEMWGGGHGVFTHFLLEGLRGSADYNADGIVTLGELIPYLSEQVRRETKNAQSPTVAGKFDPALTIRNQ